MINFILIFYQNLTLLMIYVYSDIIQYTPVRGSGNESSNTNLYPLKQDPYILHSTTEL
ncbi:hypothetical protein AY601_1231 [Pedobacter cryoconitis]|uniref:Uncharacterized protein n=1 Tax=Pedobacter cryoconitis TaxID=188932 RepID=A0A127VA42_9SPHI|nr:hypothetical protein AY601_1231 [Pedobacter cryoconitis]